VTPPPAGALYAVPGEMPDRLDPRADTIELSVVIPCLNEADTLADCIEIAQRTISENHIAGEVIAADNGSTDGSLDIAARLGARVVNVPARGYGSALMGGIAASHGRYIIMGDADGVTTSQKFPAFSQSCARVATWSRDAVCPPVAAP
jgi:glycosyltransferase involved in cell wall biosynthesis